MGRFSRHQWKNRSFSREELRSETVSPAMFETLEPRLLLDGTPDAVDDMFTSHQVVEDAQTAVFLDILANDTYDTNDTPTITISPIEVDGVEQPINGEITVGTNGQGTLGIYYKPYADFSGLERFRYTLEDSNGSDTAIAYIMVDESNDAPTANNDSYVFNMAYPEMTFDVLANDSDPETDDTFTVTSFTDEDIHSPATISISEDGQSILYHLNDGATGFGEHTFQYTITDSGGLTSTASVTVREGSIIANDTFSLLEEEDSENNTLDVLANDTGDSLEIIGVSDAANGLVQITGDGALLHYTPDVDFYGMETFTYTVRNAEGVDTTATVTINVENVNDAPTAVDDIVVIDDNTSITFSPLANDTYLPDHAETLYIVPGSFPAETEYATIELVDNTFVYTLKDGVTFPGRDTFTYTINDHMAADKTLDGLTSTATVTIVSTPVATNDDYTGEEGQSPAIVEDSVDNVLDVLANDTDLPTGETLTIIDVTDAQHGTVTISEDGTHLVYTPTADYFGEDTFTYTVQDEDGLSATATVTVMVANVNDNPTVADDIAALDGDARSVTIYPLDNDSCNPDTGETLTVTSFTVASQGTITKIGNHFVYRLNDGVTFNGRDQFTYTISDGNGGTATATITVASSPTPVADNYTGEEGQSPAVLEDSTDNVLDVLANDTDLPTGETLTIVDVTDAQHGTVAISEDGTHLVYTPTENYYGQDTFTYTVQDEDGLTATATVNLVVTNTNDAPIAADDTFTIDYSAGGTELDVLANDYDVDPTPNYDPEDENSNPIDTPTIKADSLPAATDIASVTLNEDGDKLVFTPGASFDGTYTFTYTIVDSEGNEATATVDITMKPGAADDTLEVSEDSEAITLDFQTQFMKNDSNANLEGTLTITNVSQLRNRSGTFSFVAPGEGESFAPYITYQPYANFHGTDTFTYTIENELGLTDTATVTIVVNNDNDTPIISQTLEINVNVNSAPQIIDLASYFWDPDSMNLTYHFTTNMGEFDVLLYEYQTPETVANFLQYVTSGTYVNSFIHRSVTDFVIQGGGFTFNGNVTPYDPITNEPGISNTRGTIAMAKLDGDPDSATSQWFVNLGDNSANLDNQNGGFTVFGEVLGDGMDVIDAIAALPIHDLSGGDEYSALTSVPLVGYDGESEPLVSNLVSFQSIEALPCDVPMTYEVIGNSNPELVTPSVDDNGRLILQFANNNQGDVVQLTIRATDSEGAFVDSTVTINVNDNPDLVVNFGKVTVADCPAVGSRGTVQLIVSNLEPYVANGRIDMQLWISLDGDVTDGVGDVLLTTLENQFINLKQNKSKTFTLSFYAPNVTDPGEYSLVAVVNSGKAIPEHHEDNNTTVYDEQTYGFYSPFVDLSGGINKFWYKNYFMTIGENGYADVTVKNFGNTTAVGQMNITLYLTNSNDATASDILIGELNNISLNLAAEKYKTYRVRFTLPSNVSQDEYWLYAVIDSGNQINEVQADLAYDPEENNNAFSFIYRGQSGKIAPTTDNYKHDIAVQLPDIRTRVYKTNLSYAPMQGERAWARLMISNYSYVRAKGRVNVQLYLRPYGSSDTSRYILLASKENFAINLNAYKSKLLLLSFKIPETVEIGEYQLCAVISSASEDLQESPTNATNNKASYGSYQIQEAFVDLTPSITRRITKNSYCTQGDRVKVQVTITNKGNTTVRAKGVVVNLWACTTSKLDTDGAEKYLLSTQTINIALGADRFTRRNFNVILPGLDALPAGDYYLVAEVDATDVVNEIPPNEDDAFKGENNNTVSVYRGLRVGLPNLQGVFQKITLPANVISGTNGKATVKIYNTGKVVANGRYNITLYASTNGTYDANDTKLGELLNKRIVLQSGRTTNVTVPVTLPFDLSGEYTILAVIDSADTIHESNENDNTVVSQTTYNVEQAHVDLTGTVGAIKVANPAIGGAKIVIPLTITNTGNATIRQAINVTFAVTGGVNAELGTATYFIALAPGKSKTFSYTAVVPNVTETQSYQVVADIDSGNNVSEWRPDLNAEDNNQLTSAATFVVNPTFVILNGTLLSTQVANPATGNDNMKATVQFNNTGNIKYTGTVTVTFQTDTGVVLGQKNVTLNLNPGQATNVSHTMTLPADLANGEYNVEVVVTQAQPNAAVTVNSNGTAALTVGAPNLTAAILGNPLTGTLFTNTAQSVQVQVSNVGNVRSQGQADVQLWATSDGVIDGVGDYLLSTLENQTFNFQPGQGSTHTLNFTLPDGMTNTDYQLATMIVNPQDLFNEVTADNTSTPTSPFSVVDGLIDLAVTADWNHGIYANDGDPETADNIFLRGQQYAMTVSVTNTGNIPATNFDTKLQASSYFDTSWHDYDSPVTFGTLHIDTLAPGETFTGTLLFTFSTDLPATQTYDVVIVTDADGVVAETNEGNNQADPDGLSGARTYYFAV